ncbi:MAG: 1-acyl-sn-glycerol-3-phosphate acyltransferase [Akkermansiaceae bacterium]|jgi:1-acyl-sn-glycerol-3-phosphate acyltransferase|nr:1-acyl-sn-glycerol-3-phosphate acyltransferase [Akkermansiaceae bacterium]MDP4722657.1 1-acyl-sn-glycerol-3-phosphate acyltransferase [Akkermansiaceae bacterium]
MLEFSDAPYRFFEAKPSAPVIALGKFVNRAVFLKAPNHRVSEIQMGGAIAGLKECMAKGDRIMFAINHPTHSDAQVMCEVQRRLGVQGSFMAAYDVFLRSPMNAWFMQRLGNFSIDREGSDRKAMAAAIEILKEGKRALNIYPEGNVFLTNDRLAPFLDGAAFIALKAQVALDDAEVKVVPVSVKFTNLTAPRDAVTARMRQLAGDSGYIFPQGSGDDPVAAVLGLGQHVLHGFLERHGISKDSEVETLHDRLKAFSEKLMDEVCGKLKLEGKMACLTERIAKARSRIHQLRTDFEADPDPEIAMLSDRAILAMRIHGYCEPYLTERPTIDRYDETVERISEDFYGRIMPRAGARRAMVEIHEPISMRDYSEMKLRDALPSLTGKISRTVQSGIDAHNKRNDAPGAGMAD